MFQFHREWHFDRHDSYPVMNSHQELHNWVLPWKISPGNLLLPCFEDRCQSCEDFCYNWLNVNPVYVAGWMMNQLFEHVWTSSWNPWKLKIDSWRLGDHQRFQFHVESTWRCSKASIVKLPWSPWFSMSQVSLLSWLVESKIHHRKNGTSWVFFRSLQVYKIDGKWCFLLFILFVRLTCPSSILWGLSQCSQMCFHMFSIQSSLVILLEMVCHLFSTLLLR